MLSTVKKIVIFLIFLFLPFSVHAETLDVYLFYGEECAYCHQEREFLDIMVRQYHGNVEVHEYEVWHDSKNAEFMMDVKDELGDKGESVPYTVIGEKTFNGFQEETGTEILKAIDASLKKMPGDTVKAVQNDEKVNKVADNNSLVIPIIGETDITQNIWLNTILLALADTFTLNNLFAVFFTVILIMLAGKYKKTLALTILSVMFIVYGLLIFDVLTFNNLIQTVVKTVIAASAIIVSAFALNRFIKKLDNKKDNKLETFIFKHQKIWTLVFGLIFGLLFGLIFVNAAKGYPHILDLILQINGLSNIYYILYFLVIVILDLLLIFMLDFILNKFKLNKYILCFVILIILSIILIFWPKLFLFTS